MIDNIVVDKEDENSFNFENFELVIHSSGNYILNDSGYFLIEGIQSFKQSDSEYIIVNEDKDSYVISKEEFEQIKDILIKYA